MTSWTVAHQASLCLGFPKQEYWNDLPFPNPGDLPNPGIKPTSPALAGRFFTTEPLGKPVDNFTASIFQFSNAGGWHRFLQSTLNVKR